MNDEIKTSEIKSAEDFENLEKFYKAKIAKLEDEVEAWKKTSATRSHRNEELEGEVKEAKRKMKKAEDELVDRIKKENRSEDHQEEDEYQNLYQKEREKAKSEIK